MRTRVLSVAAVLAGLAASTGVVRAQRAADPNLNYRREIFEYSRDGRPDPFHSLLDEAELGVRIEDLTLRGVIYNSNPSRSVAIFSNAGSERPIRAQVGDRIGGIRILAIGPHTVDVLSEEFGIARRATIEMVPASKKGEAP